MFVKQLLTVTINAIVWGLRHHLYTMAQKPILKPRTNSAIDTMSRSFASAMGEVMKKGEETSFSSEEIAKLFVSLIQEISENNKRFDSSLNTIDKRHTQNYLTLKEFTDSIEDAKKMFLRETPVNGIDGYTPIKGRDYFDGYTPIKGEDYFDGTKGEKGDDGSPDMPEDVRDKLESLDEENRLPVFAIKGLKKELDRINKLFTDPSSWLPKYYGGANQLRILLNGVLTGDNGVKNLNIVGATVSNDNQGNATITFSGSGGGGFTYINEIVPGSSTTFTLKNVPVDSTRVALYGGGSRLYPGVGNDYTITAAVITMANSYASGQVLADYS